MSIRTFLRARVLVDQPLELRELELSKLLLLRSSNVEQTIGTVEFLRHVQPDCQIHLLGQAEFSGSFKVDQQFIYPFAGGFLLNEATREFFEELAAQNYPLVLLMYNNRARQGYAQAEQCALVLGASLTAGIFADYAVIKITPAIQRQRRLAAQINEQISKRLKNACN